MNPYSNQQNAYRKASVNTLDQQKLIIMLYDGAIKHSGFAIQQMEKKLILDLKKQLLRLLKKTTQI